LVLYLLQAVFAACTEVCSFCPNY